MIAQGLNTPDSLSHGADIVSVPDVWAAITVFHDALVNERHPLHVRAVGEWRGLLVTVALAAAYVPNLTSEVFRLSELPPGPWADIVRRLRPLASLLENREIDEVAILREEKKVIAIAQPLTLLAPSRSLADHVQLPSIPWLRDGRFQDPLKIGGIGVEDRWALVRYLDRMTQELRTHAHVHDIAILIGLLQSFANEARPSGSEPTFSPVHSPLQLPNLPIFSAMNSPERVALAGRAVADTLLQIRPEIGTSLKGVILVDQDLDRLMGVPAGNIRIWETITLGMLKANPGLIDTIRSEAQGKGYLILTPDELFLPTLYRVVGIGSERGFDQHPPGAREHILPLSPIVLALMSGADLATSCRLIPGGDGPTLHLTLTLEKSRTRINLSRLYRDEASFEPPELMSVWPNFKAEWWKLHFGFTSATIDVQYTPVAVVSGDAIARRLDANDGFSAVAGARAVRDGDLRGIGDVTWLRDDRQIAQGIHQLSAAPEATVIEYRHKNDRKVAGLVMMPMAEQVSSSGAGQAIIGIDFGTTNTSVYLQRSGGNPEPLLIKARHVVTYSDTEEGRDLIDREFLPATDVPIPFQTILRTRSIASRSGGEQVFRDAFVYFAQRREHAIKEINHRAGLHFNLKWSRLQDGRKHIQLFLTEVVILALAEATARGIHPDQVSFRYSYPEAFRPWQLTGFEQAARNASRIAVEITTGATSRSDPSVEFRTESVSTALYFIHRRHAAAVEGLISMDIGGGTTDIAILQQTAGGAEPLTWRGSFELAGRAMLIDHLRRHPGILGKLADQVPALKSLVESLTEVATTDDDKATIATELVVNSKPFSDAVQNYLPVLAGTPEAERLRAVALTAFAGLLDYTGRVVRSLVDKGTLLPRPNTTVTIAVGGRASILFRHLLTSGDDKVKLLRFFSEATGDAMPRADIIFSNDPKEEVAYGLVHGDASIIGRVHADPPLGEAVEQNGKEVESTFRVADIALQAPIRITGAPEFRRFVARLPSIGIRAKVGDDVIANLIGEANQEMHRAQLLANEEATGQAAVEDTSAIEPPFIVILRRFVRRLAIDDAPLRLP
ncbi:hypothetical protein [Neoroseomonas rubea]|uniref:hypothetical protein n=1 Tax=Neoroseomonas rubea TaxID=2748666 RepID=UPI0018DFF15F|nr:hypothetical protein [Roseomonas rubea]